MCCFLNRNFEAKLGPLTIPLTSLKFGNVSIQYFEDKLKTCTFLKKRFLPKLYFFLFNNSNQNSKTIKNILSYGRSNCFFYHHKCIRLSERHRQLIKLRTLGRCNLQIWNMNIIKLCFFAH